VRRGVYRGERRVRHLYAETWPFLVSPFCLAIPLFAARGGKTLESRIINLIR
jgi:hypothetical protein